MFTAEDVQLAIDRTFPEEHRAEVLAALGEYVHGYFLDVPRVSMAILAPCQLVPEEERLQFVRVSVQTANLDPRDVVAAAECPEHVGAPQTRQQMREAYLALGSRWAPG